MNIKNNIGLSSLLLTSIILHAGVNGTVFQDLPRNGTNINTYGTQENNEKGVSGVTVTAYENNGSIVGTDITDVNGLWDINSSSNVRIEFSNWASPLQESPSSSAIQIIVNGGTADFALHNPADFTSRNPLLATTHFVNGDANIVTSPTLFVWPYSNTGGVNANQKTIATSTSIRSIWGLAYSKTRKNLYSATFLRRHSSVGLNGLGAIYKTNMDTNITDPNPIATLNAGTIANDVDRGLGAINGQSADAQAFSKVAKVGLGDITMSEDESTLYVMNLADKTIYELNPDSGAIKTSYLAPEATCTNGESRPFALTHNNDNLYVGTVCDASTTTINECNTTLAQQCPDLTAHVFEIPTGTTHGTEIFNMRLDYDKDFTYNDPHFAGSMKNWNPWTDDYNTVIDVTFGDGKTRLVHPVPILSSIQFDASGNMILAFSDRTSIQGGVDNFSVIGGQEHFTFGGGDILKAIKTGANSFSINNYEFINDTAQGLVEHRESAVGATTLIKGSKETVFTQYDNLAGNTPVYTKGVTFSDNDTGAIKKVYRTSDYNRPEYFGKSMGIGDLELITDPAPTEIGNKIWNDINGNGIQDANESGIAGISIELLCSGNIVETAITDAQGNYLFSNDSIETNTGSQRYGIHLLGAKNVNNCSLRVPNISGSNKQSSLGSLILTTANQGDDLHNSDAIDAGDGNASIVINTTDIPLNGANNHNFDIGFKPQSVPTPTPTPTPNPTLVPNPNPNPNPNPTTYSLGDRVWLDSNKDGVLNSGEVGVKNITVSLYADEACTGSVIATTRTNDRGFYEFNNLSQGTYCIAFTNLPENYTISPTSGSDDRTNSDANSQGEIQNINLTYTHRDEDMGIYPNDNITPEPTTTPDTNISNPVVVPTTPEPTVINHYRLGDYVWIDNNHDGIQDNNESGYNGVKVTLYTNSNCSGESNITTITANGGTLLRDGFYEFRGLTEDDYCLEFEVPENYHISHINQGNNDQLDSDVNADAQIQNIHLTQDNMQEDMGIYQTIVAGTEHQNQCECHDYTENSVSLSNGISILILIILSSLTSLLFRKELNNYTQQ